MEIVQYLITGTTAVIAYAIFYYFVCRWYNRDLTAKHANSISKANKNKKKNRDLINSLVYIRSAAEEGVSHAYIPVSEISNVGALTKELKRLGYSFDPTARSSLLCVCW